jgi:hypothetical protein
MGMARDQQILIHTTAQIKALERLAAADGRTLSAYCERVLAAHIEAAKSK